MSDPGIFNTAGLELIPQLASSVLKANPESTGDSATRVLLTDHEFRLYLAYFKPLFAPALSVRPEYGLLANGKPLNSCRIACLDATCESFHIQ